MQWIVVLLMALALGAGCGGRDEAQPAAVAEAPVENAPAAAADSAQIAAWKAMTGREKAQAREAQQEYAKGYDLLYGLPAERDRAQGNVHLRKAAELGHRRAQAMLGANYFKGRGVTRDYDEAVHWLQIAAEDGDPLAQRLLGEAYRDGRGVEKDPVLALKWLALSGRGGSVAARFMAQGHAATLTPQKRREALLMVREWRIAHGLPVKEWREEAAPEAAGGEPPAAEESAPAEPTAGGEPAAQEPAVRAEPARSGA